MPAGPAAVGDAGGYSDLPHMPLVFGPRLPKAERIAAVKLLESKYAVGTKGATFKFTNTEGTAPPDRSQSLLFAILGLTPSEVMLPDGKAGSRANDVSQLLAHTRAELGVGAAARPHIFMVLVSEDAESGVTAVMNAPYRGVGGMTLVGLGRHREREDGDFRLSRILDEAREVLPYLPQTVDVALSDWSSPAFDLDSKHYTEENLRAITNRGSSIYIRNIPPKIPFVKTTSPGISQEVLPSHGGGQYYQNLHQTFAKWLSSSPQIGLGTVSVEPSPLPHPRKS